MHEYSSGRVYGARTLPVAKESTTTVALLIWTFQRQKPQIMGGKGMWEPERTTAEDDIWYAESGDGCARIARIGAVGCQIDGGGWQRPIVHPDAEAVYRAVEHGIDWPGNQLLAQYGRQGGAPHWDVRQHLEPIYVGGRPEVRELGSEVVRYAKGYVKVIPITYCPIEPYPSNAWVDLCRAEYSAWYAALEKLTERFQDRDDLQMWEVTGTGAEKRPWHKRS